jgi:cell wall assembly regulator SMI1
MQEQLSKLLELMRRQSGLAVLPINAGSTPEEIANVERELDVSLPSDYRAFLQRHNGQSDPFMVRFPPDQLAFLPIQDVVTVWRELNEAADAWPPEVATEGKVRDVLHHAQRIPIARNEAGGAYLYLDFIPGPAGRKGQLLFNVNETDFVVVEDTFSDLIARYLALLESGEVQFVRQPPEYGNGYWFTASGQYIDWPLYEQLKTRGARRN